MIPQASSLAGVARGGLGSTIPWLTCVDGR